MNTFKWTTTKDHKVKKTIYCLYSENGLNNNQPCRFVAFWFKKPNYDDVSKAIDSKNKTKINRIIDGGDGVFGFYTYFLKEELEG